MGKRKFTEGQWQVRNNSGKHNGFFIHNKPYSNWPIACDITEDDAHLISLLPELLKSLEALVSATGGVYSNCKKLEKAEHNAAMIIRKVYGK